MPSPLYFTAVAGIGRRFVDKATSIWMERVVVGCYAR